MVLLTAAASSGRMADTAPFTTMHFALIAVLIVLVIVAIAWGMRLKRERVHAEATEAERAEQLLAHPQTETQVSPAPPPLGEAGFQAPDAMREPAPPAVEPAMAAPAVEATPDSAAYGLRHIKGLGPKAVPLLEAQGVRTLGDLAALDPARAAEVDAGMGALAGRMARDRWVEQAKLLAAGNIAAFEATYGKL